MEQGVREAAEQVVAAIRARLIDPAVPFVAAELGGAVVHTDDFFASHRTGAEWDASTAAEKADLAIDWQRLRTEALELLRAGREASWHPFDFATYDMETGSGLATELVTRQPTRVIVLDGIYSSRPELRNLVDLRVLVEAPALVRRQRHDEREATNEAMWHRRWDEAEDYYFTHVRPPESYDLVVRTDSADGYRVGSG